MKNKSLLLLVFASLSYVCETNAASLHALILCDTHADDIENGVSADYRHIKKELKRICKLTGLKEKMSTIHGDGVDSNFLKKMRKMHVEPDDVIIFYWSGHGKNLGDPLDPWPIFDFEYDDKIVSFYLVALELMQKEPRLLLAIADCCNDFEEGVVKKVPMNQTSINRISTRLPKDLTEDEDVIQKNLSNLFLNASGTFIVTSALPGEASIGLDESDSDMTLPSGSFYTNALLSVLREETASLGQDLTWEAIFQKTAERTIQYQLSDADDPQVYHHPQHIYIPN